MALAIQTALRPASWRYQRGAGEFQLLFSADHQSFSVADPIVASLVVVPKVNKICGRIGTRGTLEFQFIDELANELVKLSRRGECEGTSCARVSGGGCEARTLARGPGWESVVAGRPRLSS